MLVSLNPEVKSIPMQKEYIPKTAMSIHAHPDDQNFTVAGTLAKWARGDEKEKVLSRGGYQRMARV